ncbi:MAG: MBL fold metallo-hydrolase, partial [archaeon]|nr:MBL fold metallo-hydrolase [archaeon]
MLLIIKFIEGIYYIRQTNPLHPLSTSNGLLIIPELINHDENESSDVIDETNQFSQYKSILIDVNIERNEWYELMDFCLNQKIPKPDILIVSHLHLDHCCHSHEFVKIFDGVVVFPTSEMIGITSHDGHTKVFQIPDTLSISGREIAKSFQYLK